MEKVIYLARNKNGILRVFTNKPIKKEEEGVWTSATLMDMKLVQNTTAFFLLKAGQNCTWNDVEPLKVNLNEPNWWRT